MTPMVKPLAASPLASCRRRRSVLYCGLVCLATLIGAPVAVDAAFAGSASSSGSTLSAAVPQSISWFTPSAGPVGTSVSIGGSEFTGATAVTFNGTNASYTVDSYSSITATVPSGATTGPIRVTTPGGTATSATNFTVTDFTLEASLEGVSDASVAWGDYDNDGDLDILLTGHTGWESVSVVYRNDDGVFTDIGAGLTAVYYSSVAWGDYDNDGDLDILLTGLGYEGSDWVHVAQVYRNDAGVFTDIGAGLTGVYYSSVAWGDCDNDGDLDILLTGYTGSNHVSVVYRNDGGVFSDIGAGLTGVSSGSVAWGDYDNDGDLDILLAGYTGSHYVSAVYRNDGGVFADIGAGLAAGSSVAWGDYDNDGDLDILLTGYVSGSGRVSRVYRNDAGVFTDIGAGLTGVSGSVAWGDYDNDGDLDILLTGHTGSDLVSQLYRNDAGVFTDIGAGLTGVEDGSVAWGDYDNDGDLDILIAGDLGVGVAWVYRNHVTAANSVPTAPAGLAAGGGAGSVSLSWAPALDGQTPAAGLTYNLRVGTSSGASDVAPPMAAASGHRRIPAMGNVQHGTSAVLWLPAGTYHWSVQAVDGAFAGSAFSSEGMFTVTAAPPTITGFTPASGGVGASVTISGGSFSDATGVAFNGTSASYAVNSASSITATVPAGATTGPISVTTPDGTGMSTGSFTVIPPPTITGFTPTAGPVGASIAITGTSFTGATSVAFNGTGASYIVNSATSIAATVPSGAMTGPISVTTPGGTATSASSFTVEGFVDIGAGLTGVRDGSVAWGDYDNDGDLDILLTGYDNSSGVAQVYRNDAGVFTDIGAGLTGVYGSSVAWGDCDNDGDLDILLTGFNGSFNVSQVYRNDAGVFTDIGAGLTRVDSGSVAWGDYDNDGDLDILLTGGASAAAVAQVYRNDGGVFTDVMAGLTGVYHSSGAWGDYDNDGDLDILSTGYTGSGYVSQVYRNDGGVFTDVGAGLRGVGGSSVAWGDYDNDGDLDILLTGYDGSISVALVYRNDGGVFTTIGPGLSGVSAGSVAWGDYDNDGDLDVLISGFTGSGYLAQVYRNDAGVFTDMGAELPGVDYGSVAWGDYDNDGDLDILLAGYAGGLGEIAGVYRNDVVAANTVPSAPTGLAAANGGDSVTLSWAAASDAQTAAAGLTYNLRVGTSSGASDVTSPMAAASGYRRIPALGNAQQGTSAVLRSLPEGTYHWSVQAVDTAFAGSAFSSEGAFIVGPVPEPTITGFTPTSGPAGTSVSITGTTFIGVTDVAFNGMSASHTVDSVTAITATVPSGATTGPISVTTPGGTAVSAGSFTVIPTCAFGIAPTSVSVPPTADSQVVTITMGPAGCAGDEWTTAGNGSWLTVSPANGTGSGSVTVSWDATGFARSGEATIAGETFTVVQSAPSTDYFTVTPCRLLDTRLTSALAFGTAETFQIGGECGVSASATAAALNLTVVAATAAGNCRLYPDPSEIPTASTINFATGLTRANNAVVSLLTPPGTVTVRCVGASPGTVHLILDVFGYFDVAGGGSE